MSGLPGKTGTFDGLGSRTYTTGHFARAACGATMKTSGILRVPALGHALSSPLLPSLRCSCASLPWTFVDAVRGTGGAASAAACLVARALKNHQHAPPPTHTRRDNPWPPNPAER